MSNSFIGEEDLKVTLDNLDNTKNKSLFINEGKNTTNSTHEKEKNKLKQTIGSIRSKLTVISAVIGEVRYRWIIFVCFFLLSFSNGVHWVTIAAISDNFIKAYNISSKLADMYSLLYMIAFPITFPVAAYIIDNKSCKFGIILAAFLNLFGAALKALINYSIAISILGQALCAIAQPFIVSASAKIASVWFRAEVRTTITSLLAVSNVIGTLFGIIFNIFFVNESLDDIDAYKSSVFRYILAEAVLNIVFSLPTILLFKSKPRHAPSVSQNNLKVPSFTENIRMLFSNRNFIFLMIVSTIIVGYFNMLATLINQFTASYNIDTTKASAVGGISFGLGLASCIVVSLICDYTKQYKPILFILCIIAIISQILMTILSEIYSDNALYILASGISMILMTCLPFYAVGMDYVCEITYPVGEMMSVGLILSGSQILGIIEVFVADYFLYSGLRYWVNIMSSIFLILSLVILIIMKEDLKRNKVETSEAVYNSDFEDFDQHELDENENIE